MAFIKDGLFAYFKKIDITYSFTDFIALIFNDSTISSTGARADRFSVDILPLFIQDKFNEYSEESTKMKEYFAEVLYPLVCKKNHSYFVDFYDYMLKGIQPYTTNEGRKALYEEIKKRKATSPALENNRKPAIEIRDYIDLKIKLNSIRICKKEEFAEVLYVIFYYLSYGFIPESAGKNVLGIHTDHMEYNKLVVDVYGHHLAEGIFMIRYLANRENPNVIALYELGDLEYYGVGHHKADKVKAYEYYKKAADSNHYFPQAGASVGYIQYYYKTRELKDVVIPELEILTTEQRKEIAFVNILVAYHCGHLMAATILADMTEDPDIPLKLRYTLKTREEYLLTAASTGDISGIFNLYKYYKKQSEEVQNEAKSKEYHDLAMEYLYQTLPYHEPVSSIEYAKICIKEGKDELAQEYLYYAARLYRLEAVKLLVEHYLVNPDYDASSFYQKYAIADPKAYLDDLLTFMENN